MPDEFWIVVTQYDCDPKVVGINDHPRGPLVHEGRLHTEDEALKRAQSLNGRYGWVSIYRVETK